MTWSRLSRVPNARNVTSVVVSLLFAVILFELLFLTLWAGYSILNALSVTGWVVGMIALVLYLQDAFSVDPVFLQIRFFPTDRTPGEYEIQATVSNEGALKISSCQVELRKEGQPPILLNRIIVEGPRGAIRADSPNDVINDFPLFSRRPVQVRGYVTALNNTRVTLVIKAGKSRVEFSPVSFNLSP